MPFSPARPSSATLIIVLILASACETRFAADKSGTTDDALSGERYGDGVRGETSVSIAEILANPEHYDGKAVRVEGTVTDVCPMRGCWFEIAESGTGESMQFKVNDGVMEFPMTAVGKHAVAEGVVRVRELTLEQTRRFAAHLAEEKGEPFDPATVTEPRRLIQLAGTGAVLRDPEAEGASP